MQQLTKTIRKGFNEEFEQNYYKNIKVTEIKGYRGIKRMDLK